MSYPSIDARIRGILINRCGIDVVVRPKVGMREFVVWPADLESGEGFTVIVAAKWRRIESVVEPGPFAGELLRICEQSLASATETFVALVQDATEKRMKVGVSIGGAERDVTQPLAWPTPWTQFKLSLSSAPLALDEMSSDDVADKLALQASLGISLMLALLPLESITSLDAEEHGAETEGGVQPVLLNRYERSPRNRSACISVHGTSCLICGFSFEAVYGPEGAGRIHVHHVTPLSEMTVAKQINPKTDLLPVCPNCHDMIHAERPARSPSSVRSLLRVGQSRLNGASLPKEPDNAEDA